MSSRGSCGTHRGSVRLSYTAQELLRLGQDVLRRIAVGVLRVATGHALYPAWLRRFWAATCPQFEQVWLVCAGGTAMSIEPHQAALYCIARVTPQREHSA
jgi:hypothetical protein